MAIFKPTIFQDISGSVGNVTTYKSGKKHIARGKPLVVKNPKSPEQLKQRARMSVIASLRRQFIRTLQAGHCSSSRKVCANCFTRDNIRKVNTDDLTHPRVDLLSLSLSGGNLRTPRMEAEINVEKRMVIFRWQQQPLMPFMSKEDRLMGCVYERKEKRSRLVELGTRRKSGETEWSLPEDWDAGQLVVYGFATSENGRNASKTLGLTETGQETDPAPGTREARKK